jgi:hypothetical protein
MQVSARGRAGRLKLELTEVVFYVAFQLPPRVRSARERPS